MEWREIIMNNDGNMKFFELVGVNGLRVEVASTVAVSDVWSVVFGEDYKNAEEIPSFLGNTWEVRTKEMRGMRVIFGVSEDENHVNSFRIFCKTNQIFSDNMQSIRELILSMNFGDLRSLEFNLQGIRVTGKHRKYAKCYAQNDRIIFLTRDSIVIVWVGEDDSDCLDCIMDKQEWEFDGVSVHAIGYWNVGYAHSIADEIYIGKERSNGKQQYSSQI